MPALSATEIIAQINANVTTAQHSHFVNTGGQSAYLAGINATISVAISGLSDETLSVSRGDGFCWSCGFGSALAVTPVADYRRRYMRYGALTDIDNAATALAALPELIGRFSSIGHVEPRDMYGVEFSAVEQYGTAPHSITAAYCEPCLAQLDADIVRCSDSSYGARYVGHCTMADCGVSVLVGGYSVGAVIENEVVRNGYRYGDYRYAITGITTPNQELNLSAGVRFPGQGRYAFLCAAHSATHFVCQTCDQVRPAAENSQCRRCGISNLCAACSPAHDTHLGLHDFRSPMSIGRVLEWNRRYGRPGAIVRSTRTVGQEVETGADREYRGNVLHSVDAAVREVIGTSIVADVVNDCSIAFGYDSEIRAMPVGGYVAEIYADAIAHVLQEAGQGHNLSTGAHTHVGVSAAEFFRVYLGHVVTQGLVMSLSNPERFCGGSQYAIAIRNTDIAELRRCATQADGMSANELYSLLEVRAFSQRYVTVNATSYARHQTIEIRTPSGDIPHNPELNKHMLAWISGASDFFATDEGFTMVQDSTVATSAIVSAVAAGGHITAHTAELLLAALQPGGAAAVFEVEYCNESGSDECSYCDCECDDCPCDESYCGNCDCGSDPCDHDNASRRGSRYVCDDCEETVSYV